MCFRAPPAEPKATEEIQPNCGPGFINGLVQGTSKTETIDFSHEIWGFPGFFPNQSIENVYGSWREDVYIYM
jgi:hypothetical protein